MSLYGITKGTEIEDIIEDNMKREGNGVVVYYSLALLAREQGLNDVAEELEKIGQDEARHAALYSVLNGHVNKDLFTVISSFQKLEASVVSRISDFAQRVRQLGLDKAAENIENIAQDEERHGRVLKEITEKHLK